MTTLAVMNSENKKVAELQLGDSLLKDKVNRAVLHQAVKACLAGLHHGTVRTKTRGEVYFTTKKIYRQKGTGNARHGSKKSAPFVGGGRVFGPKPRDYSIKLTKKFKKLALREALRAQLIDERVKVLDSIPFKEAKTKQAVELFKKLGIEKGLIILEQASDVVEKSVRNIKGFKTLLVNQINVYDVLKYSNLIFTSNSFDLIQKRYLS